MSFESGSYCWTKFKLDSSMTKDEFVEKLSSYPCGFPAETQERTSGWGTELSDSVVNEDGSLGGIDFGHFLFFSLVSYEKKLKPSVVKQLLRKAELEFLRDNPDMAKVPRDVKRSLEEKIRMDLLSKTFPERSTIEVVADFNSRTLFLLQKSTKAIELFEKMFMASFGYPIEGMGVPSLPYSEGQMLEALSSDFLEWLWYKSDQTDEFMASGRAVLGDLTTNESVTCIFNESAEEAKLALRTGKKLKELSFRVDSDEDPWTVALYSGVYGIATVKFRRVAGDDVLIARKEQLDEADRWIDQKVGEFFSERLSPVWSEVADAIAVWRNE